MNAKKHKLLKDLSASHEQILVYKATATEKACLSSMDDREMENRYL